MYCFIKSSGSLFSLLIISSFFQAASVINFGSLGIQPYYFVGCFFVLRTFLNRSFGNIPSNIFRGKITLLLFCVLAVFSAFTLPFLFQGIPVYDPKVGVDFFIRPPLHFGLGNIAQAAYLVLQTCIVLAAATQKDDPNRFLKTFWLSFYFLSAIICLQFLCQRIGIIFPTSIFANNPSYYITNVRLDDWNSRVMGTFSEPSLAGAVLAMFAAGLIGKILAGEKKLISLVVAITALAMIRSTSGMASVIFVTFVLLVKSRIYIFPWYIKKKNFQRVSSLIFIGLMTIGAILASPLRESLFSQTVDKSDTGSFIYRTTADLYSVLLTINTYGLGVGLGSNRPSSLLATVLSNTGVLGLGLFLTMAFQFVRYGSLTKPWIRWSGIALLIDLALSGPDITFPPMWALFALLAQIGASNAAISVKSSSHFLKLQEKVVR